MPQACDVRQHNEVHVASMRRQQQHRPVVCLCQLAQHFHPGHIHINGVVQTAQQLSHGVGKVPRCFVMGLLQSAL